MSSGQSPIAPGTPASILVVDDNRFGRDLLARQVAQLGHRASTAENGRQALSLLHAEPFDLVLLDVLMPEVDGFAVLEQIKTDARLGAIPVIMVSGLDEVGSVARCIEAGAEDYLLKPFDPVILRARIGACLEKKRLRDAERRRAAELERALQQLKAAQDRLIAHEKLASLGALTAGIAHEIRNPLNFVTNFARLAVELVGELRQLLTSRPREPSGASSGAARLAAPTDRGSNLAAEVVEVLGQLEQNAAKIEEHGQRADRIVQSMLLHARGQSGERRRMDLNALVDEYVNLAYHALRGQDASFQVALEWDLDRSLPPVELSAQDLSRVILNLTKNACHAVHEKRRTSGPDFTPRVLVRTRRQGSLVELRIRDNGNGIKPELREKLFTPFFTTKPAGSGTGLGLSISYDIVVQMHKGSLRAESEEGKYAEFIVTLPLEGTESAPGASTSEVPRNKPG